MSCYELNAMPWLLSTCPCEVVRECLAMLLLLVCVIGLDVTVTRGSVSQVVRLGGEVVVLQVSGGGRWVGGGGCSYKSNF